MDGQFLVCFVGVYQSGVEIVHLQVLHKALENGHQFLVGGHAANDALGLKGFFASGRVLEVGGGNGDNTEDIALEEMWPFVAGFEEGVHRGAIGPDALGDVH